MSHDGTAKILVATVGKIADKEFNNRVTPPETPEFNPVKSNSFSFRTYFSGLNSGVSGGVTRRNS